MTESTHRFPRRAEIIFGELDQYTGKGLVDWHTAVTMSWAQARLLAYLMRLQVAWYERQHGPVKIPGFLVPPALERPPGIDDDPAQKEFYDLAERLHREVFKS